MVTEDFSFPTITNPVAHFTFSPSLWRISSRVFSDYGDEDNVRGGDCSRKSFSYVESEMKSERDDASKEPEERMDMLWEDFNEELKRVPSLDKKKEEDKSSRSGGSGSESNPATGAMVELCRVQALKMSKTSSGILSPKRASMVVVLKVFKKLFLLRNSPRLKKTEL